MGNQARNVPFLLRWLMRRLYPFSLREGYYGDIEEEYCNFLAGKGILHARIWVLGQVFRSFPVIWKSSIQWSFAMLMSTLRITLRIIKRQKMYSFINIVGLSVGLAVFIVIILLLQYETGYDRFHQNYDRIYRIVIGDPAGKDAYAGAPSPLGPMIMENLPEIVDMVRLDRTSGVVQYGDKAFYEKRILYADPSLFNVFTFPLLRGDDHSALATPDAMVITASTARKYFGDADPIGKVLQYDGTKNFTITAIAEDVPEQSHFHFNFIVRYENFANMEHWGMWNWFTYFLAHGHGDPDFIQEKFNAWAEENGHEEMADNLFFEPLKDIHFQYNRSNLEPAFNRSYLHVFMGVAFVVLILACINFMNMSTARSTKRAREVGIKKSVGCNRGRLVFQFFGEAFVMTLAGLVLAVLMVYFCLPVFNGFVERQISLPLSDPAFLAILIALLVTTSLFSGLYPAFVLSSFQPSKVLKKQTSFTSRSHVRNILVVFQFVISIALILCSMTIYHQMRYVQVTDIGLNPSQVLNIRLNRLLQDKGQTFKDAFLQIPGVENASINSYRPTSYGWHQSVGWEGQQESMSMWIMSVDREFFKTLNIDFIEGREEVERFQYSSRFRYCLNESAVKQIGWDSAAGKRFSHYGQDVDGRILGVIRDFHFRSLHHDVAPLVMVIRDNGNQISLRISATRVPETMASIRSVWKDLAPQFDMDYYFLDDSFAQLYRSETKLSHLLIVFTGLSLFIACLGLFSLASFTAEQRSKEIGIRRTLGASVGSVVIMLSRQFTRWVIVANIIAWPVGYYAMNKWLQQFAYRVDLRVWMFLISGLVALVIAWLTVSAQTLRAATLNPVDTLRYE